MNGKQPGIMFYFETRSCLKRLTLEEKGALFEAILDYGEHEIEPDLDDRLLIAWDFIKPRIDRDRTTYETKCEKARRSAAARWKKEREQEYVPYTDASDSMRSHSDASEFMPFMPTSNPTSKSVSSSTPPIPPEFHPGTDFETERQRKIQQLRAWETDKDID